MNTYQKERTRLLLQLVDDLETAISPMTYMPNVNKDEEREYLLDSVRRHKPSELDREYGVIPPNQDIKIREALSKCMTEFNNYISDEVVKGETKLQLDSMNMLLKEISATPVEEIIKEQSEIVRSIEDRIYSELLALLDEEG
ncbi:MAG: hypothetical protein ACM3S2_21090 [Ignavibacteriales bacterium]